MGSEQLCNVNVPQQYVGTEIISHLRTALFTAQVETEIPLHCRFLWLLRPVSIGRWFFRRRPTTATKGSLGNRLRLGNLGTGGSGTHRLGHSLRAQIPRLWGCRSFCVATGTPMAFVSQRLLRRADKHLRAVGLGTGRGQVDFVQICHRVGWISRTSRSATVAASGSGTQRLLSTCPLSISVLIVGGRVATVAVVTGNRTPQRRRWRTRRWRDTGSVTAYKTMEQWDLDRPQTISNDWAYPLRWPTPCNEPIPFEASWCRPVPVQLSVAAVWDSSSTGPQYMLGGNKGLLEGFAPVPTVGHRNLKKQMSTKSSADNL